MDSLRYTPKHSILPFAREVHFHADTEEWKDGGIRFFNKIVRALKGREPSGSTIDLAEAASARAAGVPIDLERLESGKPLTTRHFRKLDNPPPRLIKAHNAGLAAEVYATESQRTAHHLKQEVRDEFMHAASLESKPLSWDDLKGLHDMAANTVVSRHADAFFRQAPALMQLNTTAGIYGVRVAKFSDARQRVLASGNPVLKEAMQSLQESYEVISESPLSKDEIEVHLRELDLREKDAREQLAKLDDLASNDPGDVPVSKALSADLKAQLATLQAYKNYFGRIKDADPLSHEALNRANDWWFASAQVVVDEIPGLGEQRVLDVNLALAELRNTLQQQELDRTDASSIKASLKSKVKDTPKQINAVIREVLNGKYQCGIDKADLASKLDKEHKNQLDTKQQWKTIDEEVRFSFNGAPVLGHSTITPASQLGDIFQSKYATDSGINCADTAEANHAVNLATSELTIDDSDGKTHTIFRGVRHAVNSAFGIESDEDRAKANEARAKEGVIAALSLDKALLADALKGKKVKLSISSISLMTPDDFRGGNAEEKRFTREQLDAWYALVAEQPLKIQVPDPANPGQFKTVNIKLDVQAFSFGVNAGAVGPLSPIVGGWHNVEESNLRALTKLLGDPSRPELGGKVGAFLALQSEKVSPEKKAHVMALARQIKEIWNSESYKEMGNDPYKMVARLAVLSHMIGLPPLWNCKSGKDRTGMLDVEAKFLAARIELTGKVPEPDLPLTEEEQALYRQLLLPNLKMQGLNTSLEGFKTEGVEAITERVGGDKAREVHRGASAAVGE